MVKESTSFILVLSTLWCWLASGLPTQETFRCPSDGHFADENDCTKYYHCANGRPYPGHCPSSTFWDDVSRQCAHPEESDCDFSPAKARKLLDQNPVQIYQTFDDGPGQGTTEVLDSLKKYGVRATFFINSDNLAVSD